MEYSLARQYVLERLQQELPAGLYYHGVHHTIDVCQAAESIASAEQVQGDDLALLLTAALFHDLGFIHQYQNNEAIGSRLAQEILPRFQYNTLQIELIKKLILSTCVPQNPQTHLEEIICDADLDYLGRPDFFTISESLKKEWQAIGIISNESEWREKQLNFLQSHRYFTKTAQANREEQKQKHIALLQNNRA